MKDMSFALARTGRVQSWIDNPESRLPVSCTVINVQDWCTPPMAEKITLLESKLNFLKTVHSPDFDGNYPEIEFDDGIVSSWSFAEYALRHGAGVAVHISALRPAGHDNGRGLISSGPCSFMEFYAMLNKILRRGGQYRNGAVTLHMDLSCPDVLQFIETPRSVLPWAKRCVNITQEMWDASSPEVRQALISGIARGDIWLAKVRWDNKGNRIFFNVCLEVALYSRGTCLLEHVSVSACELEDLPEAFKQGMEHLCSLHPRTNVGLTGEYLPPNKDKQVGLGIIGLANLLSLEGVTYAEFADALEGNEASTPAANKIVEALQEGINKAAEVARDHKMERAFAIAPTASCSYRYVDRAGYTTTPEIAPPIGRIVDRDSSQFGVTQVDYGHVETAEQVGWDDYYRVANGVMLMYHASGLLHGYSFNTWSDLVTYNEDFIQQWLDSPQTSMYYALQVKENAQAKDDVDAAFDGQFDFSVLDQDEDSQNDSYCVSCAE